MSMIYGNIKIKKLESVIEKNGTSSGKLLSISQDILLNNKKYLKIKNGKTFSKKCLKQGSKFENDLQEQTELDLCKV